MFKNLEESVQKYIITIFSWLFQNCPLKTIHNALGTKTLEASIRICKKYKIILNNQIMCFPKNNNNSVKLQKKILSYSHEQMKVYQQNMLS